MFADNIFIEFISQLRLLPSLLISLITLIFCLISIHIIRKKFGYAGLCAYMVLVSMIANIQVLYATSYELVNMPVLLGTIVFCSSFLACDIINIEYGDEKAKKAVILTIFMDVFFFISIIFTLGHKPLDHSLYPEFGISEETVAGNITAIQQIFIPIPRLLIASYSAYLLSQLSEIWLFNLFRKLTFIGSQFIKHNISLFLSNVCVDTLTFTGIGMCLLSSEPLSLWDFLLICFSAMGIRIICNFANTAYIKISEIKNKI